MRLFEGTQWDIPPRCDRCGKLEQECQCPPPTLAPQSQTARIAVEKRSKGKVVTIIRGLSEEGNDLPDLLTRLKNGCGAGGTIREGELEIQGNQLERVRQLLSSIGFRVKG